MFHCRCTCLEEHSRSTQSSASARRSARKRIPVEWARIELLTWSDTPLLSRGGLVFERFGLQLDFVYGLL